MITITRVKRTSQRLRFFCGLFFFASFLVFLNQPASAADPRTEAARKKAQEQVQKAREAARRAAESAKKAEEMVARGRTQTEQDRAQEKADQAQDRANDAEKAAREAESKAQDIDNASHPAIEDTKEALDRAESAAQGAEILAEQTAEIVGIKTKAAVEAEARRKAAEEARKKAAEEAKRKAAEEAEAKRKAEEAAAKAKAEAEAAKAKAEAEKAKAEADEAAQQAAEESAQEGEGDRAQEFRQQRDKYIEKTTSPALQKFLRRLVQILEMDESEFAESEEEDPVGKAIDEAREEALKDRMKEGARRDVAENELDEASERMQDLQYGIQKFTKVEAEEEPIISLQDLKTGRRPVHRIELPPEKKREIETNEKLEELRKNLDRFFLGLGAVASEGIEISKPEDVVELKRIEQDLANFSQAIDEAELFLQNVPKTDKGEYEDEYKKRSMKLEEKIAEAKEIRDQAREKIKTAQSDPNIIKLEALQKLQDAVRELHKVPDNVAKIDEAINNTKKAIEDVPQAFKKDEEISKAINEAKITINRAEEYKKEVEDRAKRAEARHWQDWFSQQKEEFKGRRRVKDEEEVEEDKIVADFLDRIEDARDKEELDGIRIDFKGVRTRLDSYNERIVKDALRDKYEAIEEEITKPQISDFFTPILPPQRYKPPLDSDTEETEKKMIQGGLGDNSQMSRQDISIDGGVFTPTFVQQDSSQTQLVDFNNRSGGINTFDAAAQATFAAAAAALLDSVGQNGDAQAPLPSNIPLSDFTLFFGGIQITFELVPDQNGDFHVRLTKFFNHEQVFPKPPVEFVDDKTAVDSFRQNQGLTSSSFDEISNKHASAVALKNQLNVKK